MNTSIAGYVAPTLPPIPELKVDPLAMGPGAPLPAALEVSVLEVETACTLRSLDDGGVALAPELGHDLAPHWGEWVALLESLDVS